MVETHPTTPQLLTLSQTAALLPTRPHPSVVFRWMREGVLARDGRRIRLEHLRLGRRLFTTMPDLLGFGRALAAADLEGFDAEAREAEAAGTQRAGERGRSGKARARAVEAAERALRQAGVISG